MIQPGDQVFSTHSEIGTAGGVPTPGFDWRQVGIGFMLDRPRSERLARMKTRARRSLDPAALAALDVQWMVLSPGDQLALDPTGRARLADPERFGFVERFETHGQARLIYRILPGALKP